VISPAEFFGRLFATKFFGDNARRLDADTQASRSIGLQSPENLHRIGNVRWWQLSPRSLEQLSLRAGRASFACSSLFITSSVLIGKAFGIRRDGQARSALRGALFRSIASGVSRRSWHLRQNTKALAYECASLGSRPPPLSAGPFFTSANVMAYYCDISRLIRYSRADRRNC
jgi:hypothetical protein